MKAISTPLWRFGPFEADATEHQLRRDGEIVPVTRKSFALLATLLSRPGKLFTKAELFDIVWAGSVVTDAALSRAIRELRIALGDDASEPRYIATAHGLGFRFVAALEGDAAAPAPALSPPVAVAPGFVARVGELTLLDEALAAARAGQRQVVFVTGEAGIGKTALVEAFLARHAHRADLWTTQGRCVEQYGTGDAFLPIVEALENLTRQVGPGPLRSLLARFAPSWLAQLPWLAEVGQSSIAPAPAAATNAQGMLREIAHALEKLAAQRPIVLWLEDLHWSDPSSLAVVSFIAGRREPAPLLLVASFRPDDARQADSTLRSLALRLVQRGQALEARLGVLDLAAIGDYLTARFPAPRRFDLGALAAFIRQRTEGNALFVVAIVDDMVRRGTLALAEGAWSLTASPAELGSTLPDTLRQLVHHRIERLSADDRRLVEAASVAGSEFSAAAVAAALGQGTADIEDRCAHLVEQGQLLQARAPVAWPDGTVAAGFAFVHALYWQGIHEGVTHSRRADWQARIGTREEQAFGPQCASIAAELAMRFAAANDPFRAFRYSRLAAAGALSRCAYQEGIDHLRSAQALVPQLAADGRARHELETLLPLGAALMAVEGYASAEVEATYERALALCSECGRPGDLERVQRGLWNVWFSRDDLKRAGVAAEALLARARDAGDAPLIFDALAKLGQVELQGGAFAASRGHLEAALAMSDAGPTYQREAPRLLAYLSWVLWYQGEPDSALACSERSLQAIGPDISVHTHALLLGHAGGLRLLRGDADETAKFGHRQCTLSVEHGLVYWLAWGNFMVGWVACAQGRSERGTVAMRDATETMVAMGTTVGITSWMYLLAEAELASGRPAAARAALAPSGDLLAFASRSRNAAETARVEGELALAEGGPGSAKRAEACFVAARSIAQSQGARTLELRAAVRLARLRADQGDARGALAVLAPVYAGFDQGFETLDLRGAKSLLDALSR